MRAFSCSYDGEIVADPRTRAEAALEYPQGIERRLASQSLLEFVTGAGAPVWGAFTAVLRAVPAATPRPP